MIRTVVYHSSFPTPPSLPNYLPSPPIHPCICNNNDDQHPSSSKVLILLCFFFFRWSFGVLTWEIITFGRFYDEFLKQPVIRSYFLSKRVGLSSAFFHSPYYSISFVFRRNYIETKSEFIDLSTAVKCLRMRQTKAM